MDGPDGGKGVVLVINELGGSGLDVGGIDGVDPGEDFGHGETAAVGEELAADVLGNVGVPVELHQHVGLELGLGPGDLLIGGLVHEPDHVGGDIPHEVLKLVVGGDSVNAEEASVLVAIVESHEAVGKLVLSDLLAQFGSDVLSTS